MDLNALGLYDMVQECCVRISISAYFYKFPSFLLHFLFIWNILFPLIFIYLFGFWLYLVFVAAQTFSLVIMSRGYSLVVVCALLIAMASLAVEHELYTGFSSCGAWVLEHRHNSCDTRAQLLCNTWAPPRSGNEPVSPALAANSPPVSHQGNPFLYIL